MRKTAFLMAVAMLFAACDKPEGESPSFTSEVFPYTKDGQTLYYRIVGDHAEVTHPVPSWDGYLQPEGDIVIPETVIYQGKPYIVTSIGDSAFYGCAPIVEKWLGGSSGTAYFHLNATIPSTIVNIGNHSCLFRCDDELYYFCYVSCQPAVPPTLGQEAFNFSFLPISGTSGAILGRHVTIHVPCESFDRYISTEGWSDVYRFIKCDTIDGEDISLDAFKTAQSRANMNI